MYLVKSEAKDKLMLRIVSSVGSSVDGLFGNRLFQTDLTI